jgi:leader peptidase (prepilin peptidase)/N-methyltransferase
MVVDIGYFVLLCLLGGVLAWIDLDRGIIPDWLNLAIAGLGLSKVLER